MQNYLFLTKCAECAKCTQCSVKCALLHLACVIPLKRFMEVVDMLGRGAGVNAVKLTQVCVVFIWECITSSSAKEESASLLVVQICVGILHVHIIYFV
jgi:hypothetical protein